MSNAASLSSMKKDELVALCKEHGITGYSKLKKDELVALLTEALKDDAAPAAAEAPAEKKAPAKKCCTKKETANSDLSRCCTALVNLWGIAPATLVAAVYNYQHNAALSAADVIAAAPCTVVENELIHDALVGKEDELKALRKKQATSCNYNYYIPSGSHIDELQSDDFREKTHEFIAMCEFMVRSFNMSEEAAHDNTSRILNYLNDESDISRLMGELAGSGIRFEDDVQFRNFAILMDKMKDASRFWGFCGHTPSEVANYAPKRSTAHVYKVGRNDPCPCGSGKKYKKCCGR